MAARFLVAGGTGLWDSTTNWASISGGSSGASVPIAGDTVAFDSLSGNAPMTVNVASACASLIMSGTYAGTLTFNSTLTLTSTCTFLSTCTVAGTAGTLIPNGAATLTSAGKTLTCALSLGQASFTLADNWTVNGLVTINTGAGTTTVNSNKITCAGGFRVNSSSGAANCSGTAKIEMIGGTWDAVNGQLLNDVDLNGNVTISGTVIYGTRTLRYVSGTITTTGSTISISIATTLDTAGVVWNNLTLGGIGVTYTLTSALAWSGTLTLGNGSTITINGAALSGTGAATVSGASVVVLNNTGGLVTTGILTLPNAACTFAGTAGFTVGTLTTATLSVSRIHTLTFGNTYRVTTSLTNVGTTAAIRQAIISSSAGNQVVFTLNGTSTLQFCDPTDIDSSLGNRVVSTSGVFTNSLNWLGQLLATLISKATGNFTAAGTWALCSVAGELDSEAASASVTTSNLDSTAFVLEANQVDAVAIKASSMVAVPSGTLSVTLRNSTVGTNVATVIVNVIDLGVSPNTGWFVFPLGLNHTPNGTDSYLIRLTASVSGQIVFYSLTANNWTRQVRRTTTVAPAVNDKILIAGEHTGAGTGNSFTVTMDNTATTSFGPVVAAGPPQGITVNKRGTLTYSTNLAALLRMKGILAVYGGGTLNIGTSGARVAFGSSAVLEFDCVANVDSGLNVFPGGTFNAYGDNARLTNTLLTTDEAIGSTVLGVASTAGWQAGDELAIASTTRTAAECEKFRIVSVDNATQVTGSSLPGSCTTFSGSNYLTRADNASLEIGGQDFTISCWFNVTSISTILMLVSKSAGGATTSEYELRANATSVQFVLTVGVTTATATLSVPLVANVWYFVVGTFNTTTKVASVSINNGLPSTATGSGASLSSTNPFNIGSRNNGTNNMTGSIGPVGLWKSAAGGGGQLTAAQITELYNYGFAKRYADLSAGLKATLVSWYDMGSTADANGANTLTNTGSVTFSTAPAMMYAHSGTSPTQAEVVNLTRNVKIRGVSVSLSGYLTVQIASTINIDYVEFSALGSGTINKRGIDANNTSGPCSITHCSLHDYNTSTGTAIGLLISGAASNGVVFSNNVCYNIATQHLSVSATTGTWTADSNVFILNVTASNNLVTLSDAGGTFTNNTMAGATNFGCVLAETGAVLGTQSGNTFHSGGSGMRFQGIILGTVSNFTAWRNNSSGLVVDSGSQNFTFNTGLLFGNVNQNMLVVASNTVLTNFVVAGDSTFSTTFGTNLASTGAASVGADTRYENCTFGVASGVFVAHSSSDILASGGYSTTTLYNCLLASITEISAQNGLPERAYVRSQRHDQQAGNHKAWTRYGTISIDTTIFDAASPSVRMTPNNASNKLAIDGASVDGKGAFRVAVASDSTATVLVKVRKSVVGDGTAYNGNQPRLVLRKNIPAGIAADVVLATMAGPAGAWETISGTTPAVTDDAVLSFVVDCDGTLGWINVDTWRG